MIVDEISSAELSRQLGGAGFRVRIGPFVAELKSEFATVHSAIRQHYGAHSAAAESEFADFHVSIRPPAGFRRWFRKQAVFRFENNPPFKPLAAPQAFAMFEWGLNWCIATHCHQFLMIHAAVVERGGRAMILPAPPGSGKSTLCAALVARGWRLLSDEMTLIDAETGAIVPMPRPISLKNQSIPLIARFWPDAPMNAVVHDTIKGSIAHVRPPAESVRRAHEPARPGWIVLPRYRSDATTALQPITRGAGFMHVADNAFNYSVHGRHGFEMLASLVDASTCYEFTYGGSLDDAVRVFDELADRA